MTIEHFDLPKWLDVHAAPVVNSPTQTTADKPHATRPAGRARNTQREPSHAEKIRRAALYLAEIGGAVSGDGGHDATFYAACRMVNDFGCDREDTLALLRRDFNPRCEPPWTDSELEHKVVDAVAKVYEKPNGWKLRESISVEDEEAGEASAIIRPVKIIVGPDLHRVIDAAEVALGLDPNAYQRGRFLVQVVRERLPTQEPGVYRSDPQIGLMAAPYIRERLSKYGDWATVKQTKDGPEEIPIMPPDYAAHTLLARQGWDSIRPLKSVASAPFMRPDGSIVSKEGYDESTGILYKPNADFLPVANAPSKDEAADAAERLMVIVEDFPFKGPGHKAAWLAALLSPFARHAVVEEAFPMFLFDAHTRGSGKTKLADLISVIFTGCTLPRTVFPGNEEEMRKRMTAIALAGKPLVLLDNIPNEQAIGGPSLETVLTGTIWEDRLLGKSEMTGPLPMFTLWYATGNNVTIKGDNLRRIVYCRLQSAEEKPEERPASEFQHPKIIAWVRENRLGFVRDALTILRGFHVAGRPEPSVALTAVDYPGWCDLVRFAVHWAAGIDPCESRKELEGADGDAVDGEALIHGWDELPKVNHLGETTAAVAITIVKDNPNLFDRLRDSFMRMSKGSELPNSVVVGMRLKKFEGRIFGTKRIASSACQGVKYWRVEDLSKPAPPTSPSD